MAWGGKNIVKPYYDEAILNQLKTYPEITNLSSELKSVFPFLSQKHLSPAVGVSISLVNSYRGYKGVNGDKINELVRMVDEGRDPLVEHFVRIMTHINALKIEGDHKKRSELKPFMQMVSAIEGDMSLLGCLQEKCNVQLDKMMRLSHSYAERLSVWQTYERKMLLRYKEMQEQVKAVAACPLAIFERVKHVCKLKDCANCGIDVTEAPKQCSKCKLPYYCSRACQGQHWKQGHKHFCVPVAEQKIKRLPCITDYSMGKSTRCAVCLELCVMKIKILKCGHFLHARCASLVALFCNAKVCPICRIDFD